MHVRDKLFLAIKNKDINTMKTLLEEKPNLQEKNLFGQTPLLFAVNKFFWQGVILLVNYEKFNIANSTDYFTALFKAVMQKQFDAIQVLLSQGTPLVLHVDGKQVIKPVDNENLNNSLLTYAIKFTNDDIVTLILKHVTKDCDSILFYENSRKQTPIQAACLDNKCHLAEQIFTHQYYSFVENRCVADFLFYLDRVDDLVNSSILPHLTEQILKMESSHDPLRTAAYNWSLLKQGERTLRYLLNNGWDQAKVNSKNETALELASKRNHWDCVELLIQLEDERKQNSVAGFLDLHYAQVLENAIKSNSIKMVEFLLQHQVKLRENALIFALQHKKALLLKLLLEYGANFLVRDAHNNKITSMIVNIFNYPEKSHYEDKEYFVKLEAVESFIHTHFPEKMPLIDQPTLVEQCHVYAHILYNQLYGNKVEEKDICKAIEGLQICYTYIFRIHLKKLERYLHLPQFKNTDKYFISKTYNELSEKITFLKQLLSRFITQRQEYLSQSLSHQTLDFLNKSANFLPNELQDVYLSTCEYTCTIKPVFLSFQQRITTYFDNFIIPKKWQFKLMGKWIPDIIKPGHVKEIELLLARRKTLNKDIDVIGLFFEFKNFFRAAINENNGTRHPNTDRFYKEQLEKMNDISFHEVQSNDLIIQDLLPDSAPPSYEQHLLPQDKKREETVLLTLNPLYIPLKTNSIFHQSAYPASSDINSPNSTGSLKPIYQAHKP